MAALHALSNGRDLPTLLADHHVAHLDRFRDLVADKDFREGGLSPLPRGRRAGVGRILATGWRPSQRGIGVSSRQSREELARFLRSQRQKITPGQVGLPDGTRRRVVGLRRAEVAVLAGLSPTWYTYLEQARNVRPSPEVLDSLAKVLAMSEDERLYLHQLAGHPPPPPLPKRTADGTVAILIRELTRAVGGNPYPLYVLDYMGNVMAWNPAAVTWYTDWERRRGLARNIVWWLLTDAEARERILDWEDDARDIVGRTRAIFARYPQDPRFRELIRSLHEASVEFRHWWADQEIRGQRLRVRRFRPPATDRPYTTWLAVVHPSDDPSVSIVFHFPKPQSDVS
jgi:transcriptional regulator with XRE-family HTH domain